MLGNVCSALHDAQSISTTCILSRRCSDRAGSFRAFVPDVAPTELEAFEVFVTFVVSEFISARGVGGSGHNSPPSLRITLMQNEQLDSGVSTVILDAEGFVRKASEEC